MICSKIEDNITTDVDWLNRVNQSNITHRTIIQRKLQTRKPNELFLKDKGRYTIKASMISEFSIIPWLLPPIVESQRRESLSSKKGETIEIVTAALNFLWNEVLDEEDYEYLKQYYLINGCPKRILWGIVSAKSHLETFRLNRMNKRTQVECLNLVVRISNTAQNILNMIQNNDPLFEQKKFILSNIDIYPLRLQIDLLENIVDNRDCEFVQQLFMLSTSGNTVGS